MVLVIVLQTPCGPVLPGSAFVSQFNAYPLSAFNGDNKFRRSFPKEPQMEEEYREGVLCRVICFRAIKLGKYEDSQVSEISTSRKRDEETLESVK
jgi:hypothetical protein